jgi:molybdate-binding protein
LRDLYSARGDHDIEISHSGSGGSLKQLESGDCDVSGFHLANGVLRQLFSSAYRGLINPADMKVIEAVKRRQGLIVQKNNPKNIRKITDLINPEVRLVNRQPESGTRLLLDVLLQRQRIDGKNIAGYDNEEFTHSAVSALVAGKSADVAVGTEASAIQFGLDFLPLVTETYYYCVHQDKWQLPRVQALVAVLSSESWRRQVNKLEGYDAKQAGSVSPAQAVLGE